MSINSYDDLQNILANVCGDNEIARQLRTAIDAAGIDVKHVDYDVEQLTIRIQPQSRGLQSELLENLQYYRDRQEPAFERPQEFNADIDSNGNIEIRVMPYSRPRPGGGYMV